MKHINIFTFILVLIDVIFFCGCSSSESGLSQLALFISPGGDAKIVLASGEKEKYEVNISTMNDRLKSFVVTSFDRNNGERLLLEKSLDEKKISTSFIYTAPEIPSEEMDVVLTFKVEDNTGLTAIVERKVKIHNNMILLPEKSGIVLYSPYSGKPDALSLEDVSRPFILGDVLDSDKADIIVCCDSNFNDISWRSNTGAKFIRSNNFNYAEATALSLSSTYKSSLRSDVVRDLCLNDVIIVGHGEMAEGVFLVTNINRGDEEANFMILNYKGIEIHNDIPEITEDPDDNEKEMS